MHSHALRDGLGIKGNLLHSPGLIKRLAKKDPSLAASTVTALDAATSDLVQGLARPVRVIVKISYRLGVDPELSQTLPTRS
jgi:hypothetical protein